MKKKVLALILALVMVAAFVAACDSDPAEETTGGGDATTPATTGGGAEGNVFTGEIGMYDPDYNYNANQRYKVAYLVSNNSSGLYTATEASFAHWSSLMNIDFSAGLIDFAGDNDAMMAQLPQLARDYDGLLMDADATLYARVNEIMQPTGTPWISFMSTARDYAFDSAPLLCPNAGFDQWDVGYMFGEYLYDKANDFVPGIAMSEFGFISVDYSGVPAIHDRELGAFTAIQAKDPDMAANRYFVADTVSGWFDADTAQAEVSAVLAMNPNIRYWLVFGEIDDLAQGAEAALRLAGLADNSFVTTFGGSALVNQWDSGVQNCFKSAFYLPQTVFTEPVIGALYAFMNGDSTPTEIWPEWQDAREDTRFGTYATRKLPFYEIRFEDYKHMLAWSDIYANSNLFPTYPREGITRDTYSARVEIPPEYKG